jgi:hypothetical protein
MHRKSIDNFVSRAAHSRLSGYVTTIAYNDAVVPDGALLEGDVLGPVDLSAFNLAIKQLRHRIQKLEIIASRPTSDKTPALFHSDIVLSVSNLINTIRTNTALSLDVQLYIQEWDGDPGNEGISYARMENRANGQRYLDLLTTQKLLKHLFLISTSNGYGNIIFQELDKTFGTPSLLASLHVHLKPIRGTKGSGNLFLTWLNSSKALKYLSLQGSCFCQGPLELALKNLRHTLISLRLGDIPLARQRHLLTPDGGEKIEKASWVSFVYSLQEMLSLQRFELHGLLQICRWEGEKIIVLKEIWDEFDPLEEVSRHGVKVRIEQFVVGQADTPLQQSTTWG